MTDPAYARYLELQRLYPALFASKDPHGFATLAPEPGISAVVYEDAFVCVIRDHVRTPAGDSAGYIRILPKPLATPGAAVLPILGDKVLLLQQHRHVVPGLHLEIPRGFAETGETPEQAATRELLEETGLQCSDLYSLGGHTPDSGLLAATVQLFCARISDPSAVVTEAGVGYVLVSSDELERLIADGTIRDGFTISAATRAFLRGYLSRK